MESFPWAFYNKVILIEHKNHRRWTVGKPLSSATPYQLEVASPEKFCLIYFYKQRFYHFLWASTAQLNTSNMFTFLQSHAPYYYYHFGDYTYKIF